LDGGLLLALAGACVWRSEVIYSSLLNKSDWLTTERLVTRSSLDQTDEAYSPQISFQFMAGGKQRTVRGWRLGGDRLDRDEAEAVVAKYAQGSRVTVYYNPRHPSMAVLDPDLSEDEAVDTGVSFCGFVSGAIGLYLLLQGLMWLPRR
jgi:hypothetical protein